MTRQHSSTEVRRKQIVNAAAKLIVKYGSEHVTIKKIAQEIGTSEAAIYRHFKSKADILSLLIEDAEAHLFSELQSDRAKKPSTLEELENTFTEHMSGIVHRRGIYFQVIAEIISFGDQQLNNKVYNVVSNYKEHVKELLSQGVEIGAVRQDLDLDAAADLFFGMTQGLVNTWTLSHYSFDLKQRYAALWNVFSELVYNKWNIIP
jgi:AcrR family transcriptional regulator